MCGCNNLTLLFVKIKQTGHKNIREQAASLETVAYTVWWRGASALWNQCSLQNIVIGSYICLPEWAFCFAYDYFHAYLKSWSRPQPRLQLWLHTPTFWDSVTVTVQLARDYCFGPWRFRHMSLRRISTEVLYILGINLNRVQTTETCSKKGHIWVTMLWFQGVPPIASVAVHGDANKGIALQNMTLAILRSQNLRQWQHTNHQR